jgi:hypothetical protein
MRCKLTIENSTVETFRAGVDSGDDREIDRDG